MTACGFDHFLLRTASESRRATVSTGACSCPFVSTLWPCSTPTGGSPTAAKVDGPDDVAVPHGSPLYHPGTPRP